MFVFLSKLLPLLVYPLGLSCVLLLLALIFHRRDGLRNALVFLAFAILWLCSNRWVGYNLAKSLEWQYLPQENIPQAEAIVVLGGGTEPAEYPRPAVELTSAGDRVLYAARLYKEGKAPYILSSGGVVTILEKGTSTPAEDMAEILRFSGVPDSAIWIEKESENTHENAVFAAKILQEHNIKRVILVTSALHMPRAVGLFEHVGLEVIPAPTDYAITRATWESLVNDDLPAQLINLLPNTSTLNLTTNTLKEYIGILVYRLQGWL